MRHFGSVFLVVVSIGAALASEKKSTKMVIDPTFNEAAKAGLEGPNQALVMKGSKAVLQLDSDNLQSQSNDATAGSQEEECDVFGGMAASLLQMMSHIPPRLPGFIPGCGSKKRPHAGLVVAVPSRYEIELEWDKDRHGAVTCYYGTGVSGGFSFPPIVSQTLAAVRRSSGPKAVITILSASWRGERRS